MSDIDDNLHGAPGSQLISASMRGDTDAIAELNRRAGTWEIRRESAAAPTIAGPARELSAPAAKLVGLLLIAAAGAVFWLAFRTALGEAARGRYGDIGLLAGTIVLVSALVFTGAVAVFALRFMKRHKLLALMLLAASGWWLYTAIAARVPRPDLSPVTVQQSPANPHPDRPHSGR